MVIWGGKVCRATGVSSEIQKREAENEYHRIMVAVEEQLTQTPFLLGDRPTAVDCIVLAGLRAHFLYDPAPKKALYDKYPSAVRWVEEGSKNWDGSGSIPDFPETTSFGQFVLNEMKTTYMPYALSNSRALAQKEKAFIVNVYGEDVSYLARPYIEQSRQMIVNKIKNDLSGEDQQAVIDWLTDIGLAEAFQ